jgi:small subunit ribosomal protein S1
LEPTADRDAVPAEPIDGEALPPADPADGQSRAATDPGDGEARAATDQGDGEALAATDPADGEALAATDPADGEAPAATDPGDGDSVAPPQQADRQVVPPSEVSAGEGASGPRPNEGDSPPLAGAADEGPPTSLTPDPGPGSSGAAADAPAPPAETGALLGAPDEPGEAVVQPAAEAGPVATPAEASGEGGAGAAESGASPEPATVAPEGGVPPVASGALIGEPATTAPEGDIPNVGSGAPIGDPSATLPPPPPELAGVPTDAGRILSGTVREIVGEDVVVDLEDGRTGVINRRNLGTDAEPSAVLAVGDPVEAAVLARSDPKHRVVLSRTWALKKRAWEAVAGAAAEHGTLTGTVTSVSPKGVVVDVGVRGFVPASHLELGPPADLSSYAGQELTLKVLEVDADRERLVLSRRAVLLRDQRKSVHDVLNSLHEGEVRQGRVTSLSDYGAFVDIGGVNGLVHLSELSWHRVRHPSEVVAVGDEVDVKVLDVKVKKRRVSLSMRQLSDDPLTTLVPGEVRSGSVTRLVDFGAFVDLSGVEGLVHLSELAEHRVSAPEEIVSPGEEVRVKVLSVDRRRRRVELSVRRAAEYGG